MCFKLLQKKTFYFKHQNSQKQKYNIRKIMFLNDIEKGKKINISFKIMEKSKNYFAIDLKM